MSHILLITLHAAGGLALFVVPVALLLLFVMWFAGDIDDAGTEQ